MQRRMGADERDHRGGQEPAHHAAMASRGVTRPHGMGDVEEGGHEEAQRDDHGDHDMDPQQRRDMQRQHHQRTQWVYWTISLLGMWLIACALSFSYRAEAVAVAGGRWLPFSLETRSAALFWSDLVSGALLVVLGLLSLNPFRPLAAWGACFVGIWLNAAPLLFWAPSAFAYLNDTLVGTLTIALAILIPGMPSMILMMKHGPEQPPGWTYNPSSWPQRAVMVALAAAGWLVSRYLAAYQMGFIPSAWDPFFGPSSERVLTSEMSRTWPISDAGLGAFAYTFELLMAFMGSPARWRTMPWMVTFFGILVIPLGLTHIALVISQPVTVGAWCTLCLLAAALMLPMIPLAVDEVVAMLQFLRRARREGQPLWRTFWMGGTLEGESGQDERSPEMTGAPGKVVPAMFWGMSVPWTLALCTALGLWLMFAPAVFGIDIQQAAADGDHLVGSIVVVIAVVAMAEVVRTGRLLLLPLGLWLLIAPWVLTGATIASTLSDMLTGAALMGLCVPRGKVTERYGGWDRFIK